jgi:hypothetical protein
MHGFTGGGNAGFFSALSNVAGLTEVKARVVLNNVDTEKGLEVVGFGDGVTCLEDIAKFLDEGLG